MIENKKMQIPFNDTVRFFNAHREELLSVLEKTASSGWWLLGEQTKLFAEKFAEYCGTEYCLPVANGSDALELVLRAVLDGYERKDTCEVITVANAGGYTSAACRLVGATPVYVDIEASTQLVSIDSLVSALNTNVKAVVLTHLFGVAVNVNKVKQSIKDAGFGNVVIIEDCAQAHGAMTSAKRVGCIGDIATFSFYPTKNLGAMGDGGAIVTSNEILYDKIKQLHQYGWSKKYQIDKAFGRNSRMDELQAGILTTLLPHLDIYNERRRKIYDQYKSVCGEAITTLDTSGTDYVGHLGVISLTNRNEFIAYMSSRGVKVDIHYPILDCDQQAWVNMPMRIETQSNLTVTKSINKKIVSLPLFPHMTENEVDYICELLNRWESF